MMGRMGGMYRMRDLLNLLTSEGAEELRLEAGRPPVMVLHGKARVMDGALVSNEDVAELFRSIATEAQNSELARCGESHFIFVSEPSARFKISGTMDGDRVYVAVRNLSR